MGRPNADGDRHRTVHVPGERRPQRQPSRTCRPWRETAISALDKQSQGNRKGFFLQIEGASIDKQDHAANPCGQIGETVEFDNAIKVALDYQRHTRTP